MNPLLNMGIFEQYCDFQQTFQNKYGPFTIVLMEVGSFYELYGLDNQESKKGMVKEIGHLLNITVTRKNKSILTNSSKNPLMAGFPSPALDKYIRVLLEHDYTVILVKQYRYPIGHALLEVPAGIIEDGESPIECAQRELQEEIGYAAGDLKILSEFWTAPGFSNELMYGYVARDLTKSSLPADYDENIEIIRIPFDDVLTLISRGEIKDAKTIATLLMVSSLKKM